MNSISQPRTGMQLHDAEGRRLYLTEEERRAFMAAAAQAPREVRTFCGVLHATGCRISEALALTAQQIDLSGRVVVFESLKKRRKGIYGVTGRYVQNCTLTGHAEDRCLWVRFWKRVLKGKSRDLPSGVNPHARF